MDMKGYVADILHVPASILTDDLLNEIEIHALPKGSFLIRQGEHQVYVSFLIDGIIRGFFLDANGQEVTDCFAFRTGAPAMPGPDITGPSPISIEALTDSTILTIPLSIVSYHLETSMELLKYAYNLLMESTKMHWELKIAMYQYTARERYQWFLQTYPGLIQKVSNKYIASFLGMNPSTLSRQRTALREKLVSDSYPER